MAKKAKVTLPKKKKKGIETYEVGIWVFSTFLLALVTGLLYGYVQTQLADIIYIFGIPFHLQEFLVVFVLSIWIIFSAVYLFPKFKRD